MINANQFGWSPICFIPNSVVLLSWKKHNVDPTQLGLAFDAIIDCADIDELIKEGVLVPADYKSFFIHDLELESMDISTGDFPIEQLSNAIIKSSMIEYACNIYLKEKEKIEQPIIRKSFFFVD